MPNASMPVLSCLLPLPVAVAVCISLPNDALPNGCVGVSVRMDGRACGESSMCPLVGESDSVECDTRTFEFALPRR